MLEHIAVPLIIAAGAVFPPVCALIVGLRFYVRRNLHGGFYWDDWLVITALILMIGMAAATLRGVALNAVGYRPNPPLHFDPNDENPPQLQVARRVLWAIELMYFPALGCVKLSFLFLYRRIFSHGHHRYFKLFNSLSILTVIAWILVFFFLYLFSCGLQFSAYWISSAVMMDRCFGTKSLHLAYGITDIALDLVIALFPIPLVWGLRISCARRFAILGVFAIGCLSFAVSILRIIIYIEGERDDPANREPIARATAAIYWCLVEVGIGLLAACLPPLYALFKTKALGPFARKMKSIFRSWRICMEEDDDFDRFDRSTDTPIEVWVRRQFDMDEEIIKSGDR